MENKVLMRNEIKEEDKWDLSALYADEAEYEKDFCFLKAETGKASSFKGTLSQSPEALLKALKWLEKVMTVAEKLDVYASLQSSAESQNPENQVRSGKFMSLYTSLLAEISWMDPEILSIDNLEKWIQAEEFDNYRVTLKKLLRQKAHTLSEKEEALLSKQAEITETPGQTFSVLTNIDMDFGKINGTDLTQSTFGLFLQSKDRKIREKAYSQFYSVFKKHEQTLASLYSGSVKQDIYFANVRGFNTALDASLYRDNIDRSVYTGLIEAVHKGLEHLHRYYSLRKRILKLDGLRHYDVYVPMVEMPETSVSYDRACSMIKDALSPLGQEYTSVLYRGLTTDRWVDRYENKGKRSGAFSSGGYIGNPYILLNYKDNMLRDIFTLAHEGGHSMHSLYSKQNNPFSCYRYTIFEAEVASTFNEQLLSEYLIETSSDVKTKAYIISKQLDDTVATLFRQTMFAEFELLCHTQQENGEPLTLSSIRRIYRNLLEMYFGPEMTFEEDSDLEGLRIPHFYNAYYVYKYATGISASIALSKRVLNGGEKELQAYLGFLKSGGSRFPLDSLKAAGVDMSTSAPVETAIEGFAGLTDKFEQLLSDL